MEDFIFFDHLEDLDAESKYITHKAKEAAAHAYAPYSRFLVGAAVMLEDGTVITGTNQENAAYPSGMCAERVALYAVAATHPEAKILKLAVVARRKHAKETSPAAACGSCRQVMLEFEQKQQKTFEVIMQCQDHKWIKAPSAASLLPFAFTAENLEHGEKK
jgi:cytidine deaminase